MSAGESATAPRDTVSPGVRGARRELLAVAGTELIGSYTLLRLERGGLEPGIPGQFFMLEAPGRILPRPMSLCQAPPGELAFLIELTFLNGRERLQGYNIFSLLQY